MTRGGVELNIANLETFIYVVRLKSIHRASEALFLSQPAVTARIKSLERDLDTELFTRHGRQLKLNEQGHKFLPYAQQILQTLKEGREKLVKQTKKNEIVFGANPISSQYYITKAFASWRKSHPNLHFKFISKTHDELMTLLLNDELDFAFLGEVANSGVYQESVLDNSIRLIVYPDHPFAKKMTVTIQQLANEPLVFFECGTFDWDLVYKMFEVEGLKPNIVFNVNFLEVAKSLIKSEQGISFLPYLCVKDELEKGELLEVKFEQFNKIKQNIYLTYVSDVSVNILRDSIEESINEY